MAELNSLGQPIGRPVEGWSSALAPDGRPLVGRYSRLERLDVDRHAAQLFEAQSLDAEGRNWTYLPYEPPANLDDYRGRLAPQAASSDPLFYAIVDPSTGSAVGVGAYLRISPAMGSIEIGHLYFSPQLQRTPAATEAIFLLLDHAFGTLGYRRCEWKCDSLNAPSRKAADRFGFVYEGLFRQAMVYKGRNRDTAWYAMTDSDWLKLRGAYQSWLEESNFDEQGVQRASLSTLQAD